MVIAFDSKEFRRERFIEGERRTVFYTPLGVGVKLKNSEELHSTYKELCKEKRSSFVILEDCEIYSSNYLSRRYDHNRVSDFLFSIIYGISDFIEKIFLTYVILSPKKDPLINVGGHFCATSKIPTLKFLTQLNPMFSYLTAWNYIHRYSQEDDKLLIDAFSSKNTLAWTELKRYEPVIFPHGDECNLPISIADIIAYVTDRRLTRLKLQLNEEGITEVWKNFNFDIEIRRLTKTQLDMYRWYDYNDINWNEYQARPILFLDIDAINMRTMIDLNPYKYAIQYIYQKGGSIQGYDPNIDSKRINNGDIYVYAGEEPRRRAQTFTDMYEIEIHSVREIVRKVMEEEKLRG